MRSTVDPIPVRREQASLRALVTMERMKIVKRPMTWITFLILLIGVAAIILVAYLAIHSSNLRPQEKASRLNNFIWPTGIIRSFDIGGFLGQILLVVVAASMVGSEFGWGTIRVMVGTGAARTKLLLAKLIALTLTTIVYLLAAAAVGSLASLFVTVVGGHMVTLGTMNASWWGDLALMILRSFFVLWVLVVLAFSVASLTRSVAAGIAVGIGWPFLEQILAALLGLIGNIGKDIDKWLISTNTDALRMRNGFGPHSIDPGTPGAWHAFIVLAVYCAVLLTASIVVFRRRDIASGS
jgi:ABC-type transport system involved in multi-copper enzyme maturation permease subunit